VFVYCDSDDMEAERRRGFEHTMVCVLSCEHGGARVAQHAEGEVEQGGRPACQRA
jgi:hypothetical protein